MANTLAVLGVAYWNQGKYAEAEGLYKRALTIQEKALGANHPDVARTLDNLANVYDDQGRSSEAERLYKRVLSIREEVLGANHPDRNVSMTLKHLVS